MFDKYLRSIRLISALLYITCTACQPAFRPTDFERIIWTADWSPDGKHIAAGGNTGHLTLFSDNYEKQPSLPLAGTITSVAYDPQATLVAVSTQGPEAQSGIIILETGEVVLLDSVAAAGARGLAWSPDGSMLAVGDGDGWLLIYYREGTLLKRIKADPKSITAISWHPNGRKLAITGSQLSLYRIGRDKLTTIRPREEEVLMLSAAWHPERDLLVTGDYGDRDKGLPPLLQFWSGQGEKIMETEAGALEFRSVKWSPDGKTLASTSDKVRLYALSGELIKEKTLGSPLWGLDWHPDGNRLVVTSGVGEVFFLDNELNVLEKVDLAR